MLHIPFRSLFLDDVDRLFRDCLYLQLPGYLVGWGALLF